MINAVNDYVFDGMERMLGVVSARYNPTLDSVVEAQMREVIILAVLRVTFIVLDRVSSRFGWREKNNVLC